MEQSANTIERQKNWLEFPDEELEMDKISALPDPVLTSIISQLTTREATATSILSTRWRHLYAYVDRVEFLPLELELGQETNHQTIHSNFSDMITHTIDSHKAVSIKEFKLHVPCPEAATDGIIDRLLKFALSKKVEKMDISAHVGNSDFRIWDSVMASSMDDDRVSFPHLKELALSGVPVDDDEVAFLLANSPLLECLSISGSLKLESVSIVGLKLKRFDISNSDVLGSVEVVDALDLVSLRCYNIRSSGFLIELDLDNVPMLTELGINESRRNPVFQTLSRIPSCVLEGLQTLRLWTSPPSIWCFTKLPNMTNVRHLEIVVGQIAGYDRPPHPLFRLIEACDSLETLDIKLLGQPKDPFVGNLERGLDFAAPLEHLSSNIKKLKVSGYAGRPQESELVLFDHSKNVSSLEEFVVQLFDQTPRLRQRAERCARKYFRRIAPNYVDVTII